MKDDAYLYLAMEWCSGGCITNQIERSGSGTAARRVRRHAVCSSDAIQGSRSNRCACTPTNCCPPSGTCTRPLAFCIGISNRATCSCGREPLRLLGHIRLTLIQDERWPPEAMRFRPVEADRGGRQVRLERCLGRDWALMRRRDGRCTTLCGTEIYWAPEMVRRHRDLSAEGAPFDDRVDIWAFGVTIYQMAFSEHPFQDASAEGVFNKVAWHHRRHSSC